MSSIWGQALKISLFGESHGPGIGVVIDGLPPGHVIDIEAIRQFMARRSPGLSPWSSKRLETDEFEVLSGIYNGKTTGTPMAALIRNKDTRSADYTELIDKPRPGHADLTGTLRYQGFQDPRGGGHFSGRLTAPIVFAGALCCQVLREKNIRIAAHVYEIAGIPDEVINPAKPDVNRLAGVAGKPFPVLDDIAGTRMIEAVQKALDMDDSVGGIVEAIIWGLPAGLGDPIFDGLESRLGSLVLGIPAVRGIEFGAGFAAARMTGSSHNDIPMIQKETICYRTNHSGGVQGGISNGMPLVFRVAFKPTPSIAKEQKTVNLSGMHDDRLTIKGRHDPCIVPRAVPVVEAAAAIFALDLMLDSGYLSQDSTPGC